jgi:signal transduction histidine kinase
VALLLVCSALPAVAAEVPAQHFEQAERAVVKLDDALGGPPPMASTLWQPATLPHVVTRPVAVQPEQETGRAMAWYRVTWPGPQDGAALYVPRAIAMPLQVWRLDGATWQPISDNQANRREQWNRPLMVPMPPGANRQGQGQSQPLTLAVGVPFHEDRFHALSTLWVGPQAELRTRFHWRWALQITLPQAASIAVAAMGALSFAVWLRRRGERAYLYFAAASLVWPLRNLHLFIDLPQGELARDWFWWMTSASVSWLMLVMYLFAFRFDARRYPAVERAFVVFVVVSGLLTMPFWPYDALLLQHAANLLAALFVTALLGSLAWQGGSRELKVIVAALLLSLGFALHDWLLLAMRITPESIYLLPYGSILAVGSLLYAGLRRFVGAVEQVEAANTRLAHKLAEREREIEASHAQLRHVESEQAVLIERQRLMRDMHDGVGSTLIATLRAVEQGEFSRDGVAELLRAAIEDLRLAIDSLEPIGHDLTTLLATLRTRVGRRLEGAGLHLQWAMDDLPPLPWLDATQALQVLRLLQEALTNVIKHAGARTVKLSATAGSAEVLVQVVDDGNGFEPAAASNGRGLANMRHRVRALHGAMEIYTAPGVGTAVSIRLPVHKPASHDVR